MKKAAEKTRKSKSRRVAAEPAAAACAAPEPVDVELLRRQISNQVYSDAMGMVLKIITGVDGAHYQGMKYLFEMAGLFPPTAVMQDGQKEDSLAGMLLRHLGIGEEFAANGVAPQRNTVK